MDLLQSIFWNQSFFSEWENLVFFFFKAINIKYLNIDLERKKERKKEIKPTAKVGLLNSENTEVPNIISIKRHPKYQMSHFLSK